MALSWSIFDSPLKKKKCCPLLVILLFSMYYMYIANLRYPAKNDKFFAGEPRYSHHIIPQDYLGLKNPCKIDLVYSKKIDPGFSNSTYPCRGSNMATFTCQFWRISLSSVSCFSTCEARHGLQKAWRKWLSRTAKICENAWHWWTMVDFFSWYPLVN